MKTAIAIVILLVLASIDTADAARIRCGSSWEICAQRGRGPSYPKPQPTQPAAYKTKQ